MTDAKETVKVSTVALVMKGRTSGMDEPLFFTQSGDAVHAGDTVEFYLPGNVFPTSGIVAVADGLRVECFNALMNKCNFYYLES